MPAEWAPHQATLMEWPTITRTEFWGQLFERAKADWATVANAVAAFEPVVMITDPEQASEARAMCGEGIEILPIPIDDSWMRDNGPIFVTDEHGVVALVHFRFNSWGNKYLPFDRDAEVPKHIAAHLGMRRYEAPMVLEGGSFFVDGEGTLITTEQCLLHPTRNPDLSREQIEQHLIDALGVERVVWLGQGLVEDRDTDGHVDLIAAFTKPGQVLVQTVPEGNPNFDNCRENVQRLEAAGIEVVAMPYLPYTEVDGETVACGYMNFYLCNDAVIVPVCGADTDPVALSRIAECYPGREAVPVPGAVIAWGGGGPHCITQQVPAKA